MSTESLRVHSRLRGIFAFMAIPSLAAVPLHAQEGRASINGTVERPNPALFIPGSIVTVREAATGQSRTATTTSNGTYVVPLLPVGTYSVTCSHEGFSTVTNSGVTITADQLATVDCNLSVGGVNQSVEVSAAAEALNTTNGTIGQVISQTPIVELPLNGRNPATLVFLAPGAVDGLKAQVFTRQTYTTFPSETGASMNGGRQGSTYYMLDGGTIRITTKLLANAFPNPDATQEFQVLSNNFDAQYGFSPEEWSALSLALAPTHGTETGFEFLRNDVLNARDFFAHTRDSLKRNPVWWFGRGKDHS